MLRKCGLFAVIALPLFFLDAEGIPLEALLKAALERDGELAILEARRRIQLLQNELDDYKAGFLLSLGTGEGGLSLKELGNSPGETPLEPALEGGPTFNLTLPEETGTKIDVSLPSRISLDNPDSPRFSASLKLTQSLNELFQWKKQDLKKQVDRDSQRYSLENSIRARHLEVENTLLSLVRSLGAIERGIISDRTEIHKDTTTLASKLKGGIILKNGSVHLSALLQTRQIQARIDEAELDLTEKGEKIAELTGFTLEGFPLIPLVPQPVLPEIGGTPTAALSRWEQKKLEAELSDLKAPGPPQWDVSAGGTQGITAPDERSFSLDITGKFEDFDLSFTGDYSRAKGFSLGALFTLSPPDRGRERLRQRILEEDLAIAGQNLKEALRADLESRNNLERELKKLESKEASLRANRAFLEEYLQEMEGKFAKGFIPEVEFLKAQDQRKVLEIDEGLLNLDRHLLNNRITSQMTEDS